MDDFMTMIEDFDATFEKHRKQVETLIRRQATSRKVAKHFRLNVLKRQLESGRLLPSQIQDRTRFEPDLVQLAIAASKSLARGNSVTSQHDFLGSSDSSGGGSSGGGGGDGGGRSMPRRPEGGYPQHQQHNNFSAGSREIRRHRRPRQSTTAQQQLRDTQNAKAMVAANKAHRARHHSGCHRFNHTWYTAAMEIIVMQEKFTPAYRPPTPNKIGEGSQIFHHLLSGTM